MIVPLLIAVFAQVGAVQFSTRVSPDTVYVGQQVSYDATTLVDDAARARLRANPEFTPSEVAGATIYDFPFDTTSVATVTVDGARYRQYVYHRAMFPLTPGVYQVPSSTLRYALPDGEDYFSPPRTYTVQSAPISFVALPLPLAGRPIGFGGAVGEFKDTLRTDGSNPRVGDTFMVTVRVAGIGNLKLLPRPTLDVPWASVVAGDERVTWDSSATFVRGAKEFDWIVTPKIAGDLSLPPVRYDFFNPTTRRYEVAVTPSVSLTVAPVGAAAAVPAAPRDTIGDSPFPMLAQLARDNALAIAIGASLLALVAGAIYAITRRRPGSPEDE